MRRDAIEIIVRRSKMGDWFLLYMLGENIDTVIFRDIMQDLSNRLSINQHHHVPGMKGEIQDAWYMYGWLAFPEQRYMNATCCGIGTIIIRTDDANATALAAVDADDAAAAYITTTNITKSVATVIDTFMIYCKQTLLIIT